jgi:hypothetical protein
MSRAGTSRKYEDNDIPLQFFDVDTIWADLTDIVIGGHRRRAAVCHESILERGAIIIIRTTERIVTKALCSVQSYQQTAPGTTHQKVQEPKAVR